MDTAWSCYALVRLFEEDGPQIESPTYATYRGPDTHDTGVWHLPGGDRQEGDAHPLDTLAHHLKRQLGISLLSGIEDGSCRCDIVAVQDLRKEPHSLGMLNRHADTVRYYLVTVSYDHYIDRVGFELAQGSHIDWRHEDWLATSSEFFEPHQAAVQYFLT